MTNKEIHVSIIMPAFNAGKFIKRAISSILCQTDPLWELIVVNDGSIDNTQDVLDSIAAMDSRITVLHQENHGVAYSRQRAVSVASGEYCIHVDSDDWVENDFVEALYFAARCNDADLVWCDAFRNDDEIWEHQCPESPSEMTSLILKSKFWGVLWNKLIKRDICQSVDVKFPSDCNMWEDVAFIVSSLLFCNRIVHVNKPLYHYNTLNSDSLLHLQSTKNMNKDIIVALAHIQRLFDKYKVKQFDYELTWQKLFYIRDYIDDKNIRDYNAFLNTFPEVFLHIFEYRNYPLRTKIGYLVLKCRMPFLVPVVLKVDSVLRKVLRIKDRMTID